MSEERACERCKGTGEVFYKGFTAVEGCVYPDETKPCYACKGAKVYSAPDMNAIVQMIRATKGKNKGKLKSSWQGSDHYRDHAVARAYYVWRLARFHGGKDMTMPCTADAVLRSDPFKKELDALADEVAKVSFGTDLAGTARWARAFGYI